MHILFLWVFSLVKLCWKVPASGSQQNPTDLQTAMAAQIVAPCFSTDPQMIQWWSN